jgi:Fe2+ transport system protein B
LIGNGIYLMLIWGLAILAAIIILILIIKKLNKKKPQEVIIEKPKIPAHITALRNFRKNKTRSYLERQ